MDQEDTNISINYDPGDFDVAIPKSAILLSKSPNDLNSTLNKMPIIDKNKDLSLEMSFFKKAESSESQSFDESDSMNHIDDIQVTNEDSSISQLPNSAKNLNSVLNMNNSADTVNGRKEELPIKPQLSRAKIGLFNCMLCTKASKNRDEMNNNTDYHGKPKKLEKIRPILRNEAKKSPAFLKFFRRKQTSITQADTSSSSSKSAVNIAPNVDILPLLDKENGFEDNRILLLGKPRQEDVNKKCFIIDLDETLVHSSFKVIDHSDFQVGVDLDGTVHQVYVLKRPFVDEFLAALGELYECVLFTASLAKYADPVIDFIDPKRVFRYRLFRDSCVYHNGNYVKDLTQLGRPIQKILILDNSPISYFFQPNHAVQIQSWFDDRNDRTLLDLIPYFQELAKEKHSSVPEYLRLNQIQIPTAAVGTVGLNANIFGAAAASFVVQSNPALGTSISSGSAQSIIASVPRIGQPLGIITSPSPLTVQIAEVPKNPDQLMLLSRRPLITKPPSFGTYKSSDSSETYSDDKDSSHQSASLLPLTVAIANTEFLSETVEMTNPQTGMIDHLGSAVTTRTISVSNSLLSPSESSDLNLTQQQSTPRLSISEANSMLREQFLKR